MYRKHTQTPNNFFFWRISPFGIVLVKKKKKAHKARICWYCGPLRWIINTSASAFWNQQYFEAEHSSWISGDRKSVALSNSHPPVMFPRVSRAASTTCRDPFMVTATSSHWGRRWHWYFLCQAVLCCVLLSWLGSISLEQRGWLF